MLTMVEGGGFEPPKAEPADLQSAPFGHSGTPPGEVPLYSIFHRVRAPGLAGAGDRNRTRNLLITSQLLYQLSYASTKGDIYISTLENARSFFTHPRGRCRARTYSVFVDGCQPVSPNFSLPRRPLHGR